MNNLGRRALSLLADYVLFFVILGVAGFFAIAVGLWAAIVWAIATAAVRYFVR